MVTVDDVLRFWFVQSGPANWFAKDDQFDRRVKEHLGPALSSADRGELDSWLRSPRGCLAATIVLDQAPRNLYRGAAGQFSRDPLALRIARTVVDRGYDLDPVFQPINRTFLYLPFEHSENLADQEQSVQLFRTRVGDPEANRYAERHLEIIQRFGRFPHRNAALGRTSTEEERAFLLEPNSSF